MILHLIQKGLNVIFTFVDGGARETIIPKAIANKASPDQNDEHGDNALQVGCGVSVSVSHAGDGIVSAEQVLLKETGII